MTFLLRHRWNVWVTALGFSGFLSVVLSIVPVEAKVKINLPPTVGLPGRRVPGGARGGNCLRSVMPLTALMPASNLGKTTLGGPPLFFYVPKMSASSLLELTWEDEAKGVLHKQTYAAVQKAGILTFRLPDNALEVGKPYQWTFAIVCNPKNRALDQVVEGAIERVQPDADLTQKLSKATPLERLSLYAAAGLWQDTLLTLAELQRSRPRDPALQADWEALVTAEGVGLNRRLAQEPLWSSQETPKQIDSQVLPLPQ